MRITLLTDIPVWVKPLARALEEKGAMVEIVTDPENLLPQGLSVNRLSTRLVRKDGEKARAFASLLRQIESSGRPVVNGSRCYELGYSKEEQAGLFAKCGVESPLTARAIPGSRVFPDRRVLLKPAAGGFGKGIRALAPHEPAPQDLLSNGQGWIEQEKIVPADGSVHRVEILGDRILYDAQSPIQEGDYNYCLANAGEETVLRGPDDISDPDRQACLWIARTAGMEIGAVEYLRKPDGTATFIDLNPVSSLHPQAAELLGSNPLSLTAEYLCRKAGSGQD